MTNRDRYPFDPYDSVDMSLTNAGTASDVDLPQTSEETQSSLSLADRGWRPELCEVVQRRGRSQTRHFMFGREAGRDIVLSYLSPRLELADRRKASVA